MERSGLLGGLPGRYFPTGEVLIKDRDHDQHFTSIFLTAQAISDTLPDSYHRPELAEYTA